MSQSQILPVSFRSIPGSARAATLASLLALSGCGGNGAAVAPPAPAASPASLAVRACPPAFAGTGAECGVLSVPEQRSAPGRMLALPFVVLPAQRQPARQDPVVLIGGGPGPSVVEALGALPAEALQALPLRQDRDLVVLNQRGAALTEPAALECTELAITPGAPATSLDSVKRLLAQCRARLEGQGVALAAYSTADSAADLLDLQRLLAKQRGYAGWNVVATSYGTRVAQALLALDDKHIRTLTLDGPLPVQASPLYDASVLEAVGEVLTDCVRDAACEKTYPNLRGRVERALERLSNQPLTTPQGMRVSFGTVIGSLRGMLAAGQVQLALTALDLLGDGKAAELAALVGPDPDGIYAPSASGLYYSTMCVDDDPSLTKPGAVPEQASGWATQVRIAAAEQSGYVSRALCGAWPATGHRLPPVPRGNQLPVLVTAGQYDPITPPANFRFIQSYLPNSHLVVFPRQGHGLLEGGSCMMELARQFIDRPDRKPVLACVMGEAPAQ